ncbi:MAG: hypothetical protein L0K86_14040, partial [Actinomycetia bacterium]|nr:hypothetical protein [Actinomycetes bacterium]
FGLGDIARGARRRTPACTSTDLSRRLTQHLRRLDEHRNRIDLLERTVDDLTTEVGEIGTRLAAVERRLVEVQVAAVRRDRDDVAASVAGEPVIG